MSLEIGRWLKKVGSHFSKGNTFCHRPVTYTKIENSNQKIYVQHSYKNVWEMKFLSVCLYMNCPYKLTDASLGVFLCDKNLDFYTYVDIP